MPAAWNGARAKVQLKLAVQRTKMLQEKMEAMQKQARREIATLVEKSKIETARVKTEGLINTDVSALAPQRSFALRGDCNLPRVRRISPHTNIHALHLHRSTSSS